MKTNLKRSRYCGEITEQLIGQEITVMGWVNKQRDLNKFIFIILRDRTGLLQLNIEESAAEAFRQAKTVRGEYVLAVRGKVTARSEQNINPEMPTGKIELLVEELEILSEAATPPFSVSDTGVGTDLRLKYRYIDLRRPEMQKIMFMRHKISQATRNFLTEQGFIEIETPTLTKSSPEGARDYLVASRTYPGHFFALPQSPQLFKQLLMVSGFDKYFQITKCYRDEDLRADRQPEFTQIDMEMSFIDMEDILALNEQLMTALCKEALGIELSAPFPRMSYSEAMTRFGCDKPDTRFGLELVDITEIVAGSEFGLFENVIKAGGSVRGIAATCNLPRKQIDALAELVKAHNAKGLAWLTITEDGIKTTISKFFAPEKLQEIAAAFGAKPGDTIFLCADRTEIVFDALAALRLELAKRLQLTQEGMFNFLWVTDFPLLEYSEDDARFYAKHHPFTAPLEEDIAVLEAAAAGTAPPDSLHKVCAQAYDLVLNGYEIGGGSIRIHRQETQNLMFKTLGFTEESAAEGFGFFLEALKYGTPPHGGLAFGLDRIVMLLSGADSLREVIAFPKVKDASCPMTDAPDLVGEGQLAELGVEFSHNYDIIKPK